MHTRGRAGSRHLGILEYVRGLCFWLCGAALVTAPAMAQLGSPRAWLYDLRPGDHLTYTETAERELTGPHAQFKTKLRFKSEVIVAGEKGGLLTAGMQRNIENAELVFERQRGKDVTARERPGFQERVAGRAHFAEANEIQPDGWPRRYWQAVRESSSRILVGLHEIEPLPAGVVKVGDHWQGGSVFAMQFRFERELTIEQESCALVTGETASGKLRLSYVFCPTSGIMHSVELEGSYETFDGEMHEKFFLTLDGRKRGEDLAAWLESPATRLAALRALLLSDWLPVDSTRLQAAIDATDPQVRTLALSLTARRRLTLSSRTRPNDNELILKMLSLLSESPRTAPAEKSGPGPDASSDPPGTFLQVVKQGPYAGLPYILHIPENYVRDRSLPLVVYLAGGPGRAFDAANASDAETGKWGYFILYPDAGGRMWWESEVSDRTLMVLNEVLAEFRIDASRIFIAGFSNGGTGALYYATLWPTHFAGVVSLMGAAECLRETAPLDFAKLANVPVLLVHGEEDDVIPHFCSEDAYKSLRKRNSAVEYHLLKKRGHDITIGSDDGLTRQFVHRMSETSQSTSTVH